MRSSITGIICLFMSLPHMGLTQHSIDSLELSSRLSSKYINSVGDRSESIQQKMDQSTQKYLDGLKKQEQALQTKLNAVDPAAAERIFQGSEQAYDKLQNDLKNNSANVLNSYGRYVPGIDTAITSLKFLQQGTLANQKIAGQVTQIKSALSKVQGLEDQFKKADNVEDFIRKRKEYLNQQLSSYNLGGSLQQYNTRAYYYSQQIADLKQDWQDPSRMEQKALQVLNKLPSFQDFMKKNSLIAGLFNIPNDYSTSGIAGLQTRDQVQQMMQQQMTMMGPNGSATAQQNILDAQSSLTNLRDKIANTGAGGDLPDFKPNNQKTKSFLKRLEYGVNVQSATSSYLVPASTAFAFTVGYKINDKSAAGFGIDYLVGWGQPVQHIKISNQGIGFRSYLDVQIKGSFYASGGYEMNYMSAFRSVNQITADHLWKPSCLIGISKIISLKSAIVKQTKVQLLLDLLSFSQTSKAQLIKFRIGYNF
ncbi:MAG: hypothetical protein ABI091_15635 [Ferruginibacter sp.]